MHISGAQGKTLVPEYKDGLVILTLTNEDNEEIESVNMDEETTSLLITLLNSGVITAENINKNSKERV